MGAVCCLRWPVRRLLLARRGQCNAGQSLAGIASIDSGSSATPRARSSRCWTRHSSVSEWDCAPRRPVSLLGVGFCLSLKPRRLLSPLAHACTPLRLLSCARCFSGVPPRPAHLQAQGTAAAAARSPGSIRSVPNTTTTNLQPTNPPPSPHHRPSPLRPERCGRHFNQPCRNSYLPSPGLPPACLLPRLRLCIIRVLVSPPPLHAVQHKPPSRPSSRSLHRRPPLLDRAAVHSGRPSSGKPARQSCELFEPGTLASTASP